MNKKAIAILGAIFLLILGTLGFLLYSKYFSSSQPQQPSAQNLTQPEGDDIKIDNQTAGPDSQSSDNGDSQNQPQAYKLIDDQVISPILFYNGTGITYFNRQGQLFQATLEDTNNQTIVASKKILEIPLRTNIEKILWPAKGDNFIAEFEVQGKKGWSFFDSKNSLYVDLPAQMGSVSWLPSSEKIYYTWTYADSTRNDTVNLSDPDGKNYQKVGEIWHKNAKVTVSPDGLSILYFKEINLDFTNAIGLTTPDGKVWKTLISEGYNYGVLWSPDSKKFLFGKKNPTNQQYQLWYYDLSLGEVKNLGLFTTPDKAVWDKDSTTIYAAVPALGSQSNLTVDSFFKFNTSTFEKKEYVLPGQTLDGGDLFLNLNSTKLFFKNAQDGGLYYLDLN